MTKWTIPDDIAERLRDASDGSWMCGEWNADPSDLKSAADRIEALEAENARLRAAHLAIIQSAPTLQFAIQTSRDALYPKEG